MKILWVATIRGNTKFLMLSEIRPENALKNYRSIMIIAKKCWVHIGGEDLLHTIHQVIPFTGD